MKLTRPLDWSTESKAIHIEQICRPSTG